MALNDYADRAVDMLERPSRPIPSGRVPAATAHRLAVRGTLAGVASARVLGGRAALGVALALAASVWTYDLRAKSRSVGPAVMAACRGLDVLLGASPGSLTAAVPAAIVVAAHTATLTAVSQDEVRGGDPAVAQTALHRTAWVTGRRAQRAGGTASSWGGEAAGRGAPVRRTVGCVPAALCAWGRLRLWRRRRRPDPRSAAAGGGRRRAGYGRLQAGLLAGAGALPQALAVAAARPLATALARRRGVS